MQATERWDETARPDSLTLYLKEIGRYPLLRREQEAELATRIRAGDQDALDTLVRSNLRFVVSVAKKYQHQGVALADLINEGSLGLIEAAKRFDETRGIKFISYAVWWIRQAILQALAEQSRIVRVPLSQAGTLHRIGKRANALRHELGREATHAEIAEGMDLPVQEVAKILGVTQSYLSLDTPVGSGDGGRLVEYIPDEETAAPDEEIGDASVSDAVARSLGALREREARVLRLYFGLDGEEAMTLEEIGALFGITRERVRQIKEKALGRLRRRDGVRSLRPMHG
jgi:RNA polymerase primary sigma factor